MSRPGIAPRRFVVFGMEIFEPIEGGDMHRSRPKMRRKVSIGFPALFRVQQKFLELGVCPVTAKTIRRSRTARRPLSAGACVRRQGAVPIPSPTGLVREGVYYGKSRTPMKYMNPIESCGVISMSIYIMTRNETRILI